MWPEWAQPGTGVSKTAISPTSGVKCDPHGFWDDVQTIIWGVLWVQTQTVVGKKRVWQRWRGAGRLESAGEEEVIEPEWSSWGTQTEGDLSGKVKAGHQGIVHPSDWIRKLVADVRRHDQGQNKLKVHTKSPWALLQLHHAHFSWLSHGAGSLRSVGTPS